MRFSRYAVSGQAAIEFILLVVMIVAALICITMVSLGSDASTPGSKKGSVEFEQTRSGTVEGKCIDSGAYGKHYYVTVRNDGYEADHEVSLAEYNAAQVGADFPIVLTESDSVKSDEAQETAETADAAKAQAAEQQQSEQQQRQFMWWWLMNRQMRMNMSSSGD